MKANLNHLKIVTKLDVLKCKTAEGVTKETAMIALADNLVRSVMTESAAARGLPPERISLLDTFRWLTHTKQTSPIQTMVNPARPGRV